MFDEGIFTKEEYDEVKADVMKRWRDPNRDKVQVKAGAYTRPPFSST